MRTMGWGILIIAMLGTGVSHAQTQDTWPDSLKMYYLEEQVVVGTRISDARKNLPQSVSVISGHQLELAGTAGEAISVHVPGAFVTQRGLLSYGTGPGSSGNLTIRGVGNSTTNSQILVLVDGRPDFMGIFGHPIMDAYRTGDIERIEVIRGPSSALYGTNAMGGAVNIVTRRHRENGHHSAAGMSYGSHDTREYTTDFSGRQEDRHYTVAVSRRETDGHRLHSAYETTNISARLGAALSHAWSVETGGYLADYYSEEPGPTFAPTPDHFADIVRGGLDVTLNHRRTNLDGMVKLHGTFGKHHLGDGFRSTDRILGLVAFETYRPRPGTTLSAGFDLKRYGGKARNETTRADFGTHRVTEAAPHVHLQQVIGQHVITSGSLRLEHHALFGSIWIPQAGIVIQPNNQIALRASTARGFHSPTVKDLYLPFPASNPDLQPEHLWNIEGGADITLADHMQTGITVYRLSGEGTIHPVFGPSGPQLVNGGAFSSHGVELTGHALFPAGFYGNLSYAWFSDPLAAPGTPKHALGLSIGLQKNAFNVLLTGQQVRGLYGLTGTPAQTVPLENYGVVHLRTAWQPVPWLRVHAQIDNLFDNAYQTLPGYPMPGRTFRAGLTVQREGIRP